MTILEGWDLDRWHDGVVCHHPACLYDRAREWTTAFLMAATAGGP